MTMCNLTLECSFKDRAKSNCPQITSIVSVTSRDLNEQKLVTGSIYASVFSVVSI